MRKQDRLLYLNAKLPWYATLLIWGGNITAVLCVVGLIIAIPALIVVARLFQEGEERETHRAWCKYTGNKSKLSFNEWNSLKKSKLLNKEKK